MSRDSAEATSKNDTPEKPVKKQESSDKSSNVFGEGKFLNFNNKMRNFLKEELSDETQSSGKNVFHEATEEVPKTETPTSDETSRTSFESTPGSKDNTAEEGHVGEGSPTIKQKKVSFVA